MININDSNIEQKITEVEGNRWSKSQVESARNGEENVIYGNCGVARYIVLEDGEVGYSAMHGTQPDKARSAGFKLL